MAKIAAATATAARRRQPLGPDFDAHWPQVDERALEPAERALYTARSKAIALYAAGESFQSITQHTGVQPMTVYRCLARASALHHDGRPWGYRALLPYRRVAPYERLSPAKLLKETKAGNSGSFAQLLARHPALEAFLQQQVRAGAVTLHPSGAKDRMRGVTGLAQQFYKQCRELGLGAGDYPLNQADRAVRSMARTVRAMLVAEASLAAQLAGSRLKPESALRRNERDALVAFDTVEFDAHKLDLRLQVILEQDPLGGEHALAIERAWLLVVIDVATRCVLGWNLAFGRECDRFEVIETFRRAVLPATRPELTLPGTSLSEAGGFAGLRVPQAQYALWRQIRLDNARAHLSVDALEFLCDTLGSQVDFGPAYNPDDRPFIERFFGTVAHTFCRRLPGAIEPRSSAERERLLKRLTTPKGRDRLVVSAAELEELLAMMVWNYNGTPHSALGGRTPLDALQRDVLGIGRKAARLRYLPLPLQRDPRLLHAGVECVVHGQLARGQRPHISYLHVRYTSEQLAQRADLIGKALRIHVDPHDLRAVTAVAPGGEILQPLLASGPWRHQIHSVWLRRAFFAAKRKRLLQFDAEMDPVGRFLELRQKEAQRSKRAASDLARVQQAQRRRPAKLLAAPPSTVTTAGPASAPAATVLDQLVTGPVKGKRLKIARGFAR
jgi:putative transposase